MPASVAISTKTICSTICLVEERHFYGHVVDGGLDGGNFDVARQPEPCAAAAAACIIMPAPTIPADPSKPLRVRFATAAPLVFAFHVFLREDDLTASARLCASCGTDAQAAAEKKPCSL